MPGVQMIPVSGADPGWKGSVETFASLPAAGVENGDVWRVLDVDNLYMWDVPTLSWKVIGGGGGGAHALGGPLHTPDTLADLNVKVSDATLDDEGDSRDSRNEIYGLKLASNAISPASRVDIGVGYCRSDDNTEKIGVPGNLVADITVSGAGGLDTGMEAANTWYYVWVVKNLATGIAAGLFSMSSVAPTMPAGYAKKRRIGVVKNDGSSNLLTFRQSGRRNDREYQYYERQVGCPVLMGGTGSLFAPDFVDCSLYIPPTSRRGLFIVWEATSVYGVILSSGDFPISMSNYPVLTGGENLALAVCHLDAAQRIYSCGLASPPNYNVWVIGFFEEV